LGVEDERRGDRRQLSARARVHEHDVRAVRLLIRIEPRDRAVIALIFVQHRRARGSRGGELELDGLGTQPEHGEGDVEGNVRAEMLRHDLRVADDPLAEAAIDRAMAPGREEQQEREASPPEHVWEKEYPSTVPSETDRENGRDT